MATGFATERVLLGPVVVSFPNLFHPAENSGKFEIDIIYDKGSETHKKIKRLEKQAINNRWGEKVPGGLNLLVKDGDDKVDSDGEVRNGYGGKLFSKIKANVDHPPQITDVKNNVIIDPMEIKGGDVCVVLAHAFPYDNKSKGVLMTLSGVRKIKNGEALGGGPSGNAADEMSEYEADTGDDWEDDVSF